MRGPGSEPELSKARHLKALASEPMWLQRPRSFRELGNTRLQSQSFKAKATNINNIYPQCPHGTRATHVHAYVCPVARHVHAHWW